MDELMDEWQIWQEAQDLSVRTIAERRGTIEQLCRFSGEDPLEITPRAIMRFIGRKNDGQSALSRSSKATYHASIRAFCAWLQRTGQRRDDPSALTPRPKRKKSLPRPFHNVELVRLLRAANRRRTMVFILLGALAGLRVHEIAKIRGEDIDLVAGTITVTGKGDKTVTNPLHPLLLEEALNWPRKGYWFPNYVDNVHGKAGTAHIRSHAVTKAITDCAKRAGFAGVAHQLRHWFGTSLLKKGVDIRVVQELMRHESPATTAIYTEVDLEQRTVGLHLVQLPTSVFEAGDLTERLAA